MAITAATSANRLVKGGPGKTIYESGKAATGSSSTWGQGELICMDSSGHYLRRVAATTDAETLVGLSDNVVTSGKLAGPYDGLTQVDAAAVGPDFVGPKYGIVGQLTLKTGDAFNPGSPVYLVDSADSATVSVTDPGASGHTGNHIGYFVGPAVASAAAGQTGAVLVGARPAGNGTALVI